jgi:hypothetical protein
MVIDDLDVDGASFLPTEADPPLIIDSYAVLARTVAAQRFEAVTRRNAQILEVCRCMQ